MSVSIVGCGWVGQALAKSLMAESTSVLASYQSQSTYEKLNELKIPTTRLILPYAFNENGQLLDVDKALFEQDVMVIAIPPQLKKGKVDYPLKIEQLVALAERGKTKHIILLNSTAIYNGIEGEVDESQTLNLSAEKVATLADAERAVQGFSKQVHILRLAGLVGPKRHPGKFLQSGRIYTGANAHVNLVHQTDVVNIIKLLIKSRSEHSTAIYNVVSGTQVDRKTYYHAAAKALGLAMPEFAKEQVKNAGKKVMGDKLRKNLHYSYVYDDLVKWASGL